MDVDAIVLINGKCPAPEQIAKSFLIQALFAPKVYLAEMAILNFCFIFIGIDTGYDSEMKKLCNWLLFGMSTTDICGHAYGDEYEDSFFVISKDGLQVYTNSAGFKSFSKICTLIQNLNMYTITKTDEADPEKCEVVKVARFFEMIHDKKKIAMPCRKLDPATDFVTSEAQMVEKWPIIQAYGLDMVGNGFFTMKH